jgi:hypothetical protein
VDRVELAGLEAMANRPAAETEVQQLPPRYNAVLPESRGGEGSVRASRCKFGPNVGPKWTRVGHGADSGRPRHTRR